MSMICEKHKAEATHVCRLKNCQRRLLCFDCLKEAHRAEHESSIESVSDFMATQSKPKIELISSLEKQFDDIQKILSNYQQFLNLNAKLLDDDVAILQKTFIDITNTAKIYLKKNIKEDFTNFQNRCKNLQKEIFVLKEKFGKEKAPSFPSDKIQSPSPKLISDLVSANAEINQASSVISEVTKELLKNSSDKVTYKINPNAEEILLDLKTIFTNFMLKFFKRFKMLLVRPSLEEKFNSQINLIKQKLASEFNFSGGQNAGDFHWKDQFGEQASFSRENSLRDNSLGNALNDSKDLSRQTLPSLQSNQNPILNETKAFSVLLQADKKIVCEKELLLPEYVKAWVSTFGQFIDRSQQGPVHQSFLNVRKQNSVQLEDDSIYEGEWDESGTRTGKGRCLFADGTYYDGFWLRGQPNTVGRFISPNGELFEGMVENGKPNGKGVLLGPTGYKYVGFWKDGQREGESEETVPGKFVYTGSFYRNKHHGKGSLKFNEGMSYEGEFFEGKFNGNGVFVWPSGEKYVGCWCNNKKHGTGKYFYEDGKIYSGDFSSDLPNGFGKLVSPDGEVLEGFWKNGNPVGMAMKTQANQKMPVILSGKEKNTVSEEDQPF